MRPLPAKLIPPNDAAALVCAVAEERDREAFAQLFGYYAPRLNAYLLRIGCDAGTAEEITQDTMVTLWSKARLFDPKKSSLTTWLYRVARNRRIDGLRRERSVVLEGYDGLVDLWDETDVLSEVDKQQREKLIRAALRGLSKEQFAIVRLAFFEGLSHSQIARRIGLPLGTVKSRIRLGFARLRQSLQAHGIVEAC